MAQVHRHYPELHNPRIDVPRDANKELAAFSQGLNRSLINFTQDLNKELRIIVDQLASAVGGSGGATGVFTGTLSPNPDGVNQVFSMAKAGTLVLIFDSVLLNEGPLADYTHGAGSADIYFNTAPPNTSQLRYVILA